MNNELGCQRSTQKNAICGARAAPMVQKALSNERVEALLPA